MNPDNKSLERTYFIGGAPRVGKSILAFKLAERKQGHVVSTDSIRNAAKKACLDKNSDLFVLNRTENVSDEEWLKTHLESPEEIVRNQNTESKAFWSSVVSFCNSFVEDDAIHIVEGVALLPSLVSEMKGKPEHIIFVGNTSERHVEAMIRYGEEYPEKDWMKAMGYERDKIEGMANFIVAMSTYFKSEADKYGFSYYEIDDQNFDSSLDQIIEDLIKKKSP